jgi:fructoselysine-6-P-deglycase FrlB-like protein
MWLKDRKVVYISKSGKTPDRVGNLRLLSLLESLHKIRTKNKDQNKRPKISCYCTFKH